MTGLQSAGLGCDSSISHGTLGLLACASFEHRGMVRLGLASLLPREEVAGMEGRS